MGKLELELEVLKCKIHEEDVFDGFKENLEKNLIEKYENYEPKSKPKVTFNIYNYFGKAVAVFACFMIVSTCAFADEIEGIFDLLFANTNKNIEMAYNEGNIQEVDTEYQTYNGVSLKVDYVSVSEKNIIFVLDVNLEDECEKIILDSFKLKDVDNNMIFDSTVVEDDTVYRYDIKRKDAFGFNGVFEFSKEQGKFEDYKQLKINLNNIIVLCNDKEKVVNGDWEFLIDLNQKD